MAASEAAHAASRIDVDLHSTEPTQTLEELSHNLARTSKEVVFIVVQYLIVFIFILFFYFCCALTLVLLAS